MEGENVTGYLLGISYTCTALLLLLCSHSRNDVPPVPQRNVSIAAERGAVRPSIFVLPCGTSRLL